MIRAVRKNSRKVERGDYAEEVRLSWEENGTRRFAKGTGNDLSATGMSVQVASSIPLRTQVRIESPGFRLARYAMVRYSAAKGARFLLGLEFRD